MKNKTILFIDENQLEYIEPLKYSFSSCEVSSIPFNITPPEIEKLAEEINSKYNQVIFFDFYYNYYLLLPLLSKNLKKKWIFKYSLASLFNVDLYSTFFQIIEYQERKLIDTIAVLDYNLYLAFKRKYNLSYLQLDINLKKEFSKENAIGIMGLDYTDESSFFNELSAITLTKYKNVYVQNAMNVTKKFGEDFNLEIKPIKDIYELMSSTKINLYIKFFDTNISHFIYSMDNGTLCLLGNTEMLDNNTRLKNYLVLKSDDDINEIVEKIDTCQNNKKIIFDEYKKWRKEYSNNSQKSVKEFLEK